MRVTSAATDGRRCPGLWACILSSYIAQLSTEFIVLRTGAN